MSRRPTVQTDGYGRVLDACPNCGHTVPVPRIRVGVRAELLLPEIEPGQLRCQGCAKGVDGSMRFCAECAPAASVFAPPARRSIAQAAPAPTANEPITREKAQRRYADKPCKLADCRKMFTPTGPRAEYCERHRAGSPTNGRTEGA